VSTVNPTASAAPDVLVVGAGPVGLTLAAELYRHGVPCRIVDLNEGPSLWSKAAAVHARTLEVLEAMGIVEEALARGRRIHGISLMSEARRIGHVSVDTLDSPYPFILGLSQRDTEQLLEKHLVSLGGKVERRVELASFRRDGDAYLATLVHAGGAREEARFTWVCGCDGAHSVVRRTVGVPFEGSSYEEAILQADVRVRFPFEVPDDEGLFFVSPHGPLGALPLLGEGRYRLLALISPEEHVDPTLSQFQRLVDERGPAGTRVEDPAWMVGFRFHHRMVPRYRVDDVFLLGDAAHVHSPVGGQGMNTGIQDAFNLAWKLALVARGHGQPELLESYHAERMPIARALLAATDAATRAGARVLGLKSPLAQRLRDELFGLASWVPTVQSRVARMLGGVTVDYKDSPLVGEHVVSLRDAATGPHPRPEAPGLADWLSFERGPRPGERVADVDLDEPHDGHDRLFDLLRGTAHTLLLFGGRAESGAGYRGLGRIAAEVEVHCHDHVRVMVVTAHGQAPEGIEWPGEVVRDSGGALHQRFGARNECLYLIRPDGYVAFRSQPADGERLLAYLDRIFI
jgi:2-polyprenyl-6-methoxyphenol hydroxylase-like FAD-dependent oxidoreductase